MRYPAPQALASAKVPGHTRATLRARTIFRLPLVAELPLRVTKHRALEALWLFTLGGQHRFLERLPTQNTKCEASRGRLGQLMRSVRPQRTPLRPQFLEGL